MVSEELVKNYTDHLKHLSYCKSLRTQEIAQKRCARVSKSYGDYNWEELLLTEGLNSLYVSELDLCLKNHSLAWKKAEKEKLELITTHLKEARVEELRTMTVTGQRLLQEPEVVSDDDDDDDDDDEGDDRLSWGKHGVRRVRMKRARVRRVTRVSLSHSQRDLVAQKVGVMHQVSYSSSVST